MQIVRVSVNVIVWVIKATPAHTDRHSGVCAMSDVWRAILKSILDSVFNYLAIDMLDLWMGELINGAQAFPLHIAFTCVTETRHALPCRRIDIWAERAGRCLSQLSLRLRRYRFTTVSSSNSSQYSTTKCCVSSRTIKTELKSRTATSKYEMTWKWMRRRVMAMATTTIRQEGGISRQVWAWARYGDWAWAWVRVSVSGYAWICMLRFNIYRWFV